MTFETLLRRVRMLPPRVLIVAACALCAVAGGGALAFDATRDTRIALFATPLAPDQLADVEARLAAWNVPYAPGADNVRVDRAKRADVLLRLSIAGIPRAHLATSQELFAHAGALTPQAVLDEQTRDGLAADLALGLRGLDGVADARVIIAPARSGAYADEASHDASASVRITLASGARLQARTVAGIKAFVAGGVPALSAERVTVVDDRGLVLEGATGDDDGVQVALQSALDEAFGAGATIVRVHREPVSDVRDIRDVRRAPLGGAIARTASDEHYTADTKHYAKSASSEDRGSETHEEHRIALAGATQQLSVAIFVDGAKNIDLEKIRTLAAATAGIDTARGDRVSVEAVRFGAAPPAVPRLGAWMVAGAFAGIVPQAIVALAIAAGCLLGARPAYALAQRAVESAGVRRAAHEVAGIPPVRVRGALIGEPPHIAAAIISALPAATAAAVLELYPPEERAAIVRRLSTAPSPLVPSADELIDLRG